MRRKFVMMPVFDKQWHDMGLDDNDLQCLQAELLENPKTGDVIKGTGKLFVRCVLRSRTEAKAVLPEFVMLISLRQKLFI